MGQGRMVPGVRIIPSLLGLVMFWLPLDSQALSRSGKVCLFGEKIYTPGQSWHPYLEPQGTIYCVRCTCSENGHVNCYRLRCPPLHCSQPVMEPQQCCPRCVDPHVPSGLRVPLKSCQLNETTYQHGEIFSAQELFPARLSNQCVLCSCIEGHTYCGLMTCPEPSCPTTLPLPDSCCQTCKDRTTESSTEENLTQLQHGERHSQDPCSERRGPSTPAPTSLSSPLGFIPRHFQSVGMGSTTIKIILKEKHKKSLHTQWEDILPWGGVAPHCALLWPHALHPVHMYRWLPGLPPCDLPHPISLQSTQESGWEVLQDLPRGRGGR